MKTFLFFLDGKKTWFAVVLLSIFGVVKAFGVVLTPEQDAAIITLIGTAFGIGLTHKLEKLGQQLKGRK